MRSALSMQCYYRGALVLHRARAAEPSTSWHLPVVSFDPEKKAGRYPYRPTPMFKASIGCRGFAKEKVPVFGAGTAVSHDELQV